MTATHRLFLPLAIGAGVFLGTIVIHAIAVSATVHFLRRERRVGHAGAGFWTDVWIATAALTFALAAHLADVAVWAFVFMLCGQFFEFGDAFDHSAVNYTTLGYGDVVMAPPWRLLGPLEAADGMLMFGVSTAILFTVIQRLIQARFVDLGD